MNTNILIIGQALPAVKQEYPYDTTLLYDILSWVNISKKQAQEIFEFEAMYGSFPGFDENGGHLKPTQDQMDEHYNNVLYEKTIKYNKIILLGKVPADYFFNPSVKLFHAEGRWLVLPHPSKRNYKLIMDNKEKIIKLLNDFLK